MQQTPWFDVDKEGLARLMERRGKSFVLSELLQNGWDASGATTVRVTTQAVSGRPLVDLVVEDDSPAGFSRLEHAFTLFADSEKLVLALCDSAQIHTTKGTVTFDANGRTVDRRRQRQAGSLIALRLRMKREELDAMLVHAHSFLPPIPTTLNGELLQQRPVLREFEATLPTEWADDQGVLRRSPRKTAVRIYAPIAGGVAQLYEMGIPVCETGDQFDVEILQKVPVTLERDGVSPSYLRLVRTAVLNHAADLLDAENAAAPWVADAMGHRDAEPEAVRLALTTRFGDKVAIFDPSDREASHRAVAAGYTVVHGGTFNAEQWNKIREADALRPAGQLFPTRHIETGDREPTPVNETEAMTMFARQIETIASKLIDAPVTVGFANEFLQPFGAWYGDRTLTYNIARLGRRWFDGPLSAEHLDLTIHELGHEYESNHLDKKFNDALTKLAGRAVMLALAEPALFNAPEMDPEDTHSSSPAP